MAGHKYPKITSKIIDDYCRLHSSSPSDYLEELDSRTLNTRNHKMVSGAYLGRLLSMISKMVRPHVILEIGTFTGYGTMCLSEGLTESGIIHTIEKNSALEDFAKDIFKKAGIYNKLTQHIGDALDIIGDIDETFDLVFIDAAKRQYVKYMELILPKMNSGGVILADNVLWKGKVVSEQNDRLGQGLDAFNNYVAANLQVENILLPIDDGINIIRKL